MVLLFEKVIVLGEVLGLRDLAGCFFESDFDGLTKSRGCFSVKKGFLLRNGLVVIIFLQKEDEFSFFFLYVIRWFYIFSV